MANVSFEKVDIDFPIFNATGRSLTSQVLKIATGGRLDADPHGRVIVSALSQIQLQITNGERVGLLGHNGSGKTTLLRALSGVYSPSAGTLEVLGKIGSLIDISLGLNLEATGIENIYVRGALLGLGKKEIKERIQEIVEFTELGDFIHMPLRTYSAGMNLRLAFAVSTLVRPEILLMDEWLSVGDANFQSKAEQRLRELVSETQILVIATHSRALVESVCNRAIWLEHGTIKMDGPVAAVTAAYFV